MCLPFSSAYTTLPQTPKPLRQMDPTPTPRALLALWVLNPVIFYPYLLLECWHKNLPITG